MKIACYILILLHGIIHLFGFLKAFQIREFEALTQTISKPLGIGWLISGLLFGGLLLLLLKGENYWWVMGLAATLVSQLLIFFFWQDAKAGTLPNLVILMISIIGWAQFNFNQQITQERAMMISKMEVNNNEHSQSDFDALPTPVQQWLKNSGAMEKEKINQIYLRQEIKMKMKPEQEAWSEASAEQFFTIQPPAFNWSVDMQMNPLMTIQGRDQFEEGRGAMLMKIFSILPVVDVGNQAKINQAALQRFLAEMVWFPSAALSPYIQWEDIDEQRAKATMTFGETTGSGVFHFDANGDFVKFTTMRYKDLDATAKKHEWIAEALEYQVIEGIRVPSQLSITWKLEDRDWTWLELEVKELKYNPYLS